MTNKSQLVSLPASDIGLFPVVISINGSSTKGSISA
jgi:hypothetical protein